VQVDPTEAQSLVSPAAQELIATRLKEDHHIKNAGERERKDEMNNSTSASDSISTVASVACTRKGSRTSGSASRSPRGTIVVAIRAVIHGYYGIKGKVVMFEGDRGKKMDYQCKLSQFQCTQCYMSSCRYQAQCKCKWHWESIVASIRAIVDG